MTVQTTKQVHIRLPCCGREHKKEVPCACTYHCTRCDRYYSSGGYEISRQTALFYLGLIADF